MYGGIRGNRFGLNSIHCPYIWECITVYAWLSRIAYFTYSSFQNSRSPVNLCVHWKTAWNFETGLYIWYYSSINLLFVFIYKQTPNPEKTSKRRKIRVITFFHSSAVLSAEVGRDEKYIPSKLNKVLQSNIIIFYMHY